MKLTAITLTLFVFVLPSGAGAEQLVGTRTQAMQGAHASPLDNGAIYTNPAGTALLPRYEFSAFGSTEKPSGEKYINLSVVDSKTIAQLGGGFGWIRSAGSHHPKDDLAFALSQKYEAGAFGLTGHYRLDRDRKKHADWNMDAGFIILGFNGLLKTAVVAYNLLNPPSGAPDVHRRYTAGLGTALFGLADITADLGYNPGFAKGTRYDWGVGAEISPIPYLALRGGYGQFPSGPDRQGRWSAGAGAGVPGEYKVGYALQHTNGGSDRNRHSLELSMYFF